MPSEPDVGAAWSALERADWSTAREAFATALAQRPDDPELLDGYGRTLWWLGEHAAGVEHRRRAYAAYRRAGDVRAAANIAAYLAAEHRIAGEAAAANGWLARAARLLEDAGPCPERGWLEIEEAKRAAAEPPAAEAHAEAALAVARDLDDADLEVAALSQLGLAAVADGRIEAGMTLLDEAMALATGGEACDPLAIGDACCTILVACERLADFPRAAEWCRAVVDFTGRRGFTPLHAWCRTIYAGVLTLTGDWQRAEAQLDASLRSYEQLGTPRHVFALARLAELRVRQGRLGDAEQLLTGHEDHAVAAGALAGLALARGDAGLASAVLERWLRARGDDRALQAALLPLLADARLRCGDVAGARAAATRLRELGETLSRPNLVALADLADGTAPPGDGAALEAALEGFRHLGMPLEEGRALLALAARCAESAPELAVLQARAARDRFEQLGARRHADEAAALLRSLGAAGRTAPRGDRDALTAREREVLALLGEGLSNAAIADRLVISPKTAEHHVGRVLGKLGLASRAEAAAFAARTGS